MKIVGFLNAVLAVSATCLMMQVSAPANAAVIFSDDFESGDFSKTMGGARWDDLEKVTSSTDRAVSGSRAAKYYFPGNADTTKDSWAEMRFDLGALYPEVWIQFSLYVPSNYAHRSISPSNNKFFRIWPVSYDDRAKVGASLMSENLSRLRAEWDSGGDSLGMTTRGTFGNGFISAADRGTWMKVRIQVKAATTSTPGSLNVWKNDTQVLNNTGTMTAYAVTPPANAYRFGYLLGWANSGFAVDTYMYIDDVIFATSEADLGPASENPPAPPVLDVQ